MSNELKLKVFNAMRDLLKRLDPEIFSPLAAHANKIIHLELIDFVSLFIKILPDTIELLDEEPIPVAHTSLSGRLSDFIFSSKPILRTNTHQRTQTGLTLKGDLNCAKAFDDCLKHMDLDWEGFLADKIGDHAAVALSSFIKKSTGYLKTMIKARSEDCVYYAQDESQFVPLKEEAQAFYDDVEKLKRDVDLFEAKLKSKTC